MENSEKLIRTIRDQQLKPRPRWHYYLRELILWILFAFCVLFGALAFSIILFAIQQIDFNILNHISHSIPEMILSLIPVIWIGSVVVFLLAAMASIRNSRKGYKFASPVLVGIVTGLGMLLGTIFFISGGAGWLERGFALEVGVYESVDERKCRIWSQPEKGMLSGRIMEVSDSILKLEDFNGKEWNIDLKESEIVPAARLEEGEMIKMTGTRSGDFQFNADQVKPWGGGGHRQSQHRGNQK